MGNVNNEVGNLINFLDDMEGVCRALLALNELVIEICKHDHMSFEGPEKEIQVAKNFLIARGAVEYLRPKKGGNK